MTVEIGGVSSLATKHLLADLAERYAHESGDRVSVTSMGGVEAAARVRAGAACDFVALAADALAKLEAEGHVVAGTRVGIARSGIAVAVAQGARAPDVSSEEAVRKAVTEARAIGYSTGPSGVYLQGLFERWGIAKDRRVQAPAGVPVGALLECGDVDLGFQQMSELIHVPGIHVLGLLPPAIQSMTTFSGAICATAAHADAARQWLVFAASPATEACKRLHGLEPAPYPR
jgi:molybdate transport system substrate-binding protein